MKNGFSERVLLLEHLWHLGKGNTVTTPSATGVNQCSLQPLALMIFFTSAERQAHGF